MSDNDDLDQLPAEALTAQAEYYEEQQRRRDGSLPDAPSPGVGGNTTEPPGALVPHRTVGVEEMILRAIDKGVSVDTMERLLAMRRELKAEMAKAAFDESMAKFQRQVPPIKKTKKVFEKGSDVKVRYAYAPLESIVEQTKALISEHGFSYTVDAQVESLGDRHWVAALCKVTHSAGHSQTSQFKVPIDPDAYMNEAQKFASALTFTKRYAFVSAFGLMTTDEDDDSLASGEPRHPETSRKVAPEPLQTTAMKEIAHPVATEAHRKRFLEILEDQASLAPDLLSVAHEFFQKVNALLPNEGLTEIPLQFMPVSKEQLDALIKAIDLFGAGEEARLPYPQNPVSAVKPWDKGKKITEQAAPVSSNDPQKQPWYGIIVPIPRKGQKRGDYLKNPDTIGSLYEARHGTDDLAQESRQRLYGFLHNYEPKGWQKRDGTQMPPSETDKKFRLALDQFGDWFAKHHAGETI